jgi:hypothetical protein
LWKQSIVPVYIVAENKAERNELKSNTTCSGDDISRGNGTECLTTMG